MYMLVHNLSLEWLRTRKLQAKYLNNHPLKEVNIFNVIVEADVAMQILAEIEKLPPLTASSKPPICQRIAMASGALSRKNCSIM